MLIENRNILILADTNQRAVIATLRALREYEVSIYLCFGGKSITNKIIYRKYSTGSYLYYDSSSEESFIDSLKSIRAEIGVYTLMPFGEVLLRWAIKRRDELKEIGIIIPTVGFEKYILLSDKESFANLCRDFNIVVPTEIDVNWSSFKQKFVIKPKKLMDNNRCLRYPVLVENVDSFHKIKRLNIDLSKHLIQKYIIGPSIYYCAYWESGTCKLKFIQKNVVQQPGGKSVVKAIPYDLQEKIVLRIEEMLQTICWEGIVMIELKEDLMSREYYAIEANPRFWGPLQAAVDNGVNFPAALLGFSLKSSSKTDEQKWNRGYLWIGGYISGFLLRFSTKTCFQRYYDKDEIQSIYRDVWLRDDTFVYFLIEPLISGIKGISNVLISIAHRLLKEPGQTDFKHDSDV